MLQLDESDLDSKDIDLVMQQAGVSRSKAIQALRNNDKDIVNAIMVSMCAASCGWLAVTGRLWLVGCEHWLAVTGWL